MLMLIKWYEQWIHDKVDGDRKTIPEVKGEKPSTPGAYDGKDDIKTFESWLSKVLHWMCMLRMHRRHTMSTQQRATHAPKAHWPSTTRSNSKWNQPTDSWSTTDVGWTMCPTKMVGAHTAETKGDQNSCVNKAALTKWGSSGNGSYPQKRGDLGGDKPNHKKSHPLGVKCYMCGRLHYANEHRDKAQQLFAVHVMDEGDPSLEEGTPDGATSDKLKLDWAREEEHGSSDKEAIDGGDPEGSSGSLDKYVLEPYESYSEEDDDSDIGGVVWSAQRSQKGEDRDGDTTTGMVLYMTKMSVRYADTIALI
ncbi:hypothetical protein BV22DRAFT_1052682 [Leucogyrophana mollusca]|uniref:Uncharacterized protein n=1 Tax=Leucogyrophana mollusca TaxID=85980 RepID=A0ACB8AV58_9AGAM|nr:hypothetical protein BV22DRAFT_1052682 [Leucogyrophana mollusca]